MSDEIWEHKRGRVWRIVERQTQENRALRYQVKVLQARCRKLAAALSVGQAEREETK